MELRKAGLDDAEMILRWANDPITRANSFNSSLITYDEHMKWYERKLNDSDCLLLIANENDEPCGLIRFDYDVDDNSSLISFSIAPEWRGKGCGKKIINYGELFFRNEIPGVNLKAEVKPDNIASVNCFVKNGFEVKERSDDRIVFFKKID